MTCLNRRCQFSYLPLTWLLDSHREMRQVSQLLKLLAQILYFRRQLA